LVAERIASDESLSIPEKVSYDARGSENDSHYHSITDDMSMAVTSIPNPETPSAEQDRLRPDGGRSSPLVLVGNPNVGKSVIFGVLTGRYVTVSNYPGTTVTITRGKARLDGELVDVIDTPGVNSLLPMSEDERVTRDILLGSGEQRVLHVADARNLRRALIISTQLAEMGLPFALDLNMCDEAESMGIHVDREALESELGVPVARTVAVRRQGFESLHQALRRPGRSTLDLRYPQAVEGAIEAMARHLPEVHLSKRSLAVMLLAGDRTLIPWLEGHVGAAAVGELEALRKACAERMNEPLGAAINRARLRAIDQILARVEKRPAHRPSSWLQRLGHLSMHPLWGIPVLGAVLYLMYQFVGVFGAGTCVDFLESQVFGRYLSPWSVNLGDALFAFPHQHLVEEGVITADYTLLADLQGGQSVARFLHDFLVGPYGQVTMALSYAIALILPIVATFFIAFGLLEDSGYLPRLAVMVNRIFRLMGLNGKAVLPMVLGLGCDTMATLTTRILETRKERILVTLLLALGVPCSAQLGVILGMIRALSWQATMVWAGTVLLTLFGVGWIASKLVPGEASDFMLELPPIRRPQLGNIIVKTFARIEWYLREAVPLFLLGTLVLFLLDAFQLLGMVERLSAPVVQGILGLPVEAAESFLVGFLRRDYGAAGLYNLARDGLLDPIQLVVSMVTITLFVPCIANFFIMIKERGLKTSLAMVAVIVPLAFGVGGVLNLGLRALGVDFE
jgi:ferrous iron transport protein B